MSLAERCVVSAGEKSGLLTDWPTSSSFRAEQMQCLREVLTAAVTARSEDQAGGRRRYFTHRSGTYKLVCLEDMWYEDRRDKTYANAHVPANACSSFCNLSSTVSTELHWISNIFHSSLLSAKVDFRAVLFHD